MVRRVFWVLAFAILGCRSHALEVVVPKVATMEERRAAEELAALWLKGSGRAARISSHEGSDESIKETASPGLDRLFLGGTALGRKRALLPEGLDEDGFRILGIGNRTVILRGESSWGTWFAAEWFAQHEWGVRWYAPGPDGEVVPDLRDWKGRPMDVIVAPGFKSRELTGLDGAGAAWAWRNGLRARWPHQHALAGLFPGSLFAEHPSWFPLLEGERRRPEGPSDGDWQPNLALPEVAEHAAQVVEETFAKHPRLEGVSLSIDDSCRFDQSALTVAARGRLRWFRGRPDYSDVVFGFMNRVADQVGKSDPGKLLGAYAYYWAEPVPDFRVRSNVLPWLTSDRTEWFDARYRTEDERLIRSWCRDGPRVEGCYDYLYGAPFVVPRVTTLLTARSVRFEYDAGVRAFTAEAYPNWGFDAPKLWVLAQLLWNPEENPGRLADEFYRGYFGHAAGPMARFYAECEKVWMRQPRPGWWIKYNRDEDQAKLYPPEVRAELQADLDEAEEEARTARERRCVARVTAAFAVSERFAEFCEDRDALSVAADRIDATDGATAGARLVRLVKSYEGARVDFLAAFGRAVALGGMASMDVSVYLRDDPAARAAEQLFGGTAGESERGEVRQAAAIGGSEALHLALDEMGAKWHAVPVVDPSWHGLRTPAVLDDRTFYWSGGIGEAARSGIGRWVCHGLPVEGRTITVGHEGETVAVRYQRALAEYISQWAPAERGAVYQAEEHFRGQIGWGEQAFLVMSWMDSHGRWLGPAVSDRVPVGDWRKGFSLLVLERAPVNAAKVGVGVYLYHQLPRHYAEFTPPRLEVAGGLAPAPEIGVSLGRARP